jgi:hypothetical protein
MRASDGLSRFDGLVSVRCRKLSNLRAILNCQFFARCGEQSIEPFEPFDDKETLQSGLEKSTYRVSTRRRKHEYGGGLNKLVDWRARTDDLLTGIV